MYKYLLFFLISLSFKTYSQSSDSTYVKYLFSNKLYNDVIWYTENNPIALEENFFYKGMAFYHLKKMDSCSFYLNKVSDNNSSWFKQAKFFESLAYMYTTKYDSATSVCKKINVSDKSDIELKNLLLYGQTVLLRKKEESTRLFDTLSNEKNQLFANASNIKTIEDNFLKKKKKSPLIAGCLSAIVPGLGKLYVGKKGQAIAAFIFTSMFAAQAIEGYYHHGVKSTQFYVYATFFSMFYVGNIWGSVYSVKINNIANNRYANKQITFELHVPLRSLYNNY